MQIILAWKWIINLTVFIFFSHYLSLSLSLSFSLFFFFFWQSSLMLGPEWSHDKWRCGSPLLISALWTPSPSREHKPNHMSSTTVKTFILVCPYKSVGRSIYFQLTQAACIRVNSFHAKCYCEICHLFASGHAAKYIAHQETNWDLSPYVMLSEWHKSV